MNVLQSDLVGLQREVGHSPPPPYQRTMHPLTTTRTDYSATRGLHHAPTSAACSTNYSICSTSWRLWLTWATAASVCVLLQYVVLQRTQEALAVSRMGENGPDLSEVVKACG